MTQTMTMVGRLFFDTLVDAAYAPIWWYTSGARWIISRLFSSIRAMWVETNIAIWIKNLFVPMYGQRDAWSRGISIGLRFLTILAKLIQVFAWSIGALIIFCVWLAAPLIAVYLIVSPILHFVI